MDKYYLLIFGISILVAVIFFVLNQQGSGDGDIEIQKHLAKGKKKKRDENENKDSNKSNNAKASGLLDADQVEQNQSGSTLATWVDSEDYEQPEKLVTKSYTSKVQEKLKTDDAQQHVAAVASKEIPSGISENFKYKILLVDDSLTVRTLLGKLLNKSGDYQVILKENGLEALNFLETEKPDLVVTDIQMPEMDGFELIDAIREKERLNGMPIIAISSVFEPEDHLELLELEKIQGFIKKQNPFDEVDLLQQIKYLMSNFN